MQYAKANKWLKDRNIVLEGGFSETLHEMAFTYKKTLSVI